MAISPAFEFKAFGDFKLSKLLDRKPPRFTALGAAERPVLRQLDYIGAYVQSSNLRCRSVLIESPYIDRDYMEEHAVFYSTSLHAYENWCTRIHFFDLDAGTVERRMTEILLDAAKSGIDVYKQQCEQFSSEHYLGFSVIKPLPGSPVGRTVLRPYSRQGRDGSIRMFPASLRYKTHVLGVELSVSGLAFQQQDLGVSACATTALWSALQRRRDEEVFGPVPAQITKLASQFALPFGRSMPSEGLSVEQMCMAVQGLGLSPSLLRTEKFLTGRCYLYAAIRSGFSPVLVLQRKKDTEIAHAVAVAGANIKKSRPRGVFIGSKMAGIESTAASLEAVYVHDDRHGPYLRADLEEEGGALFLKIDPNRDGTGEEFWEMTHMLVPTHPKIRISFSALFDVALGLCRSVMAFGMATETSAATLRNRGKRNGESQPSPGVVVDMWIERNETYAQSLAIEKPRVKSEVVHSILRTVAFSRYVGVIRLQTVAAGVIDVVVDTTSTISNLDFLAVILRGQRKTHAKILAQHLSHECQCRAFP